MGKTKKHVVTKHRGQVNAGGDKRAERQARKDASNKRRYGKACNYHSREEQDFTLMLEGLGMQVKIMLGDGNCMFRSIADQLFGSRVSYTDVRHAIVNYIVKEKDTFSLFMEDDEPFADYVERMRNDKEWGGHQELYAAAQVYAVNIYVHQVDGPRFVVAGDEAKRSIHLSYHGEYHYNSVRAADDNDDGSAREISLESAENSSKNSSRSRKDDVPSAASGSDRYSWKEIETSLDEIKKETDDTPTTEEPCAVEANNTSDDVQVEADMVPIGKEKKHVRSKKEKREIEAKLGGISKKDKRKIRREIARGGSYPSDNNASPVAESTGGKTGDGTGVAEIHI